MDEIINRFIKIPVPLVIRKCRGRLVKWIEEPHGSHILYDHVENVQCDVKTQQLTISKCAPFDLTGICCESSISLFCCLHYCIFRLPKREKKPPKTAALLKKKSPPVTAAVSKPEPMQIRLLGGGFHFRQDACQGTDGGTTGAVECSL